MKAIEVAEFGGTEKLVPVERPRPEPGPGQVLIEVKAAGINFADLRAREGSYPRGPKPPFIPGMEAAGIVAALGPGVTVPAVGTRVMAFLSGGYAEYVLADAAQAVPLPESIDYAPATMLLVQGLTAYFLMRRAVYLKPGQSVLVSAAAGGVGSLAVQMAKNFAAGTVAGLASTPEKRKWVASLGADDVIDYTQPGWAEQVKTATGGKGVDIFLDATGDTAEGGLKPLAPGGVWVIYGSQQASQGGLSGGELISVLFNSQTIRGFTLYEVLPDPSAIAAALGEMFGWVASGRLHIEASHRFPLAQARQAHEAMEARKTIGKVVLEP
jgi:NADPH:quinone reductase